MSRVPQEERPALKALTGALELAWINAGPPTYHDFESRSEEICGRSRRLAASTTQEIVTGKRSGPPRLDWVHRFWAVLRAVAAGNGINPDSLVAWEELKEKHEAAWAEQMRHRQPPGATAGSPPGPGSTQELPSMPALAEAGALARIRQRIGVEWWHDYEDVAPASAATYLSLERAAELIRSYETAVVPSLLQTASYAGTVLRRAPGDPPEADVVRRVELLARRQQILIQPHAPRLWAVFHEAALLPWPGDYTDVIQTQIIHLIEISERPNVTIQLIPSGTKIRTRLGYPITLLRFRDKEIPDIVYLEQLTSVPYLHTPDHTSQYAQLLTGLSAAALHPAATVGYLTEVLRNLR